MNKNKFVIEDVKISKEKMDELISRVKSCPLNKPRIIRNYIGGSCSYCAEIPAKIIKYDVGDGAKRVEWYCDSCFERWMEKEKEQ